MKVCLVYNPVSGSGTFINHLDYIVDRFQEKNMQIVPYRTTNRENLERMFSKLNREEYKKILVAGGDGTLNQVVNCMMKYNIGIPLGIFPVGTANDYGSYFNLPNSIDEMIEILLRDNYTYSDIGLVNDRCFINILSLGFLIDVSQKTDLNLKNNLGMMAYYLKGLEELPKFKPISIKVYNEDFNFSGEIYFMLVTNGKSAGGFKKIAPFASVSDGLFEVLIFKKCSIPELMQLVIEVLRGDHIHNPNIIYLQTNELIVETDSEVATDIDGEIGPSFPLIIRNTPQKLKVITRFNHEDGFLHERNFSFYDVKKLFSHVAKGFTSERQKYLTERRSNRNLITDIKELAKDLPRHNVFNYQNKGSLGKEYFTLAEETLDNGYLYLILSSTGSAAGETISKVTKKEYSHISLSFDEELKTIVSYNGGENIYSPGLNAEMIEYFNQKEDANIIIYKIKASRKQKEKILQEITKINEQGSSYNVIGLFLPYSIKENIMFCSQFVYSMLKAAGLEYFDKKPELVKPTDFVELDYHRKLEYCNRVFIKELLDC